MTQPIPITFSSNITDETTLRDAINSANVSKSTKTKLLNVFINTTFTNETYISLETKIRALPKDFISKCCGVSYQGVKNIRGLGFLSGSILKAIFEGVRDSNIIVAPNFEPKAQYAAEAEPLLITENLDAEFEIARKNWQERSRRKDFGPER